MLKFNRFLWFDIDGVLNDHTYNKESESCSIKPSCVKNFNLILEEFPDLKVILHSAWRYMVHGKAMDLKGFKYLLRTHGISSKINLIAVTTTDEICNLREHNILLSKAEWCRMGDKYAIVDDLDLQFGGITQNHFIRTDGQVGLTSVERKKIIELLR